LGDEVFGPARSEDFGQPAFTGGAFDRVEVGRPEGCMECLDAGGSEATCLQQRGEAGRVGVDKPRMCAHAAGAEELGGHATRGAAIGAQTMALFAGYLEALGDLLEQARHGQIAGAPGGRRWTHLIEPSTTARSARAATV